MSILQQILVCVGGEVLDASLVWHVRFSNHLYDLRQVQ